MTTVFFLGFIFVQYYISKLPRGANVNTNATLIIGGAPKLHLHCPVVRMIHLVC